MLVGVEPPSSVGPSAIPARISPITRGWFSLTKTPPSSLAAATMIARSTRTYAMTSASDS